MADVFISHSSKDKEIAEKVLNFFEGRGLNCWIAPRDIVPGTEWAAAINAAITASKVFLIIYTVNSAESSQVSREISLAETKPGVFVVPYKTDDTPLVGSFEYYLVGSHFISADYSKNDYKLEELYTQVADIVGGTIPQPDIVTRAVEIPAAGAASAAAVPVLSIASVIPPAAAVREITGVQQDRTNLSEKASRNNPDKSKLPLIIGIAAAAVVVIAVVLIIVLGSGSGNSDGPDNDMLAEDPTFVETEPNVTDEPAPTGAIKDPTSVPIDSTPVPTDSTPTPIEDTPTPTETPTPEQPEKKEIKDFALQFLGHDCTGDYNGYVNASGQPQGEGVFIGTYYADYSEVRMTYTGEFKDGLANGKGISTETFVDGYVREYEGDFQGGVFDGEGTEKSTSVAGDRIEYNGSFKAGKYNGKGIKTVVNKAATPEKQVYEGTWEAGEFISGKRTGYDADGYMILSENVAEKDEKAVLMDYVTDHGNYDPDQMKYCLTKTYDELYSIIRDTGSGRTVYDTNVSINVYSYDSADDILEFTIDNNDLGVKVSVTYNTITGKYDFSSKEHLDNGDLGGMISGIFRDYLYGSEDNLTYVQAVRTTKEEFADNTRLLVNLLKRCLTDMLTEYDIGVSLDSLGLDYWH
ncbi:MAG: TIR domain-containing protein [Lachnospiraceae bacterium]|nr:TIR domain-containing protein [Lachnospiraceae bacterium]